MGKAKFSQVSKWKNTEKPLDLRPAGTLNGPKMAAPGILKVEEEGLGPTCLVCARLWVQSSYTGKTKLKNKIKTFVLK